MHLGPFGLVSLEVEAVGGLVAHRVAGPAVGATVNQCSEVLESTQLHEVIVLVFPFGQRLFVGGVENPGCTGRGALLVVA